MRNLAAWEREKLKNPLRNETPMLAIVFRHARLCADTGVKSGDLGLRGTGRSADACERAI